MQPLAESGDIGISGTGEAEALADPDMLDQVLVGLVGNALKHTPRGGEIRLTASDDESGVSIAVSDTGQGIPADELPHVFDRFWRGDSARREGGFGLGLGICRDYVEAMGGEIAISSQIGFGTTVHVHLARVGAGDRLAVQGS
jgi:signal transduction histidine kinase